MQVRRVRALFASLPRHRPMVVVVDERRMRTPIKTPNSSTFLNSSQMELSNHSCIPMQVLQLELPVLSVANRVLKPQSVGLKFDLALKIVFEKLRG